MLMRLTIVLFFSAFFLPSCQQESPAPQNATSGDIKFSGNAAFAILGPVVTDCTFDNSIVINGSSVTAYQNSSVLYGESCISEVRTCDNGFLSGSYNYSSCTAESAASCLFNGQTIPHGSTVEAYNISSVDLGGECISEMRTCDNGVLSGSNQYASCSINLPASCLFNGQTVASGQSVNAFLNSTVSFGELCSAETRYCVDGALSGSNQYATCVVDQPASCLFNGQTIAHGQTVNAFLNSSVGYGDICQSEVRRCDNGVLSGVNQYASCVVDQPASCLFNGQTIAHGASVTAYLSSNAGFGELCDAEERFCDNGQLAGSYQYASCAIDQPASCLFNGQTVASGQSVNAFLNSTVSFGEPCSAETRYCADGALSGSNQYATCVVDQPASCLFNGQTIAHGQTVVGYQSSGIVGNQQCSSEVKTCNNGTLSGSFTYASCVAENTEPNEQEDNNHKEKYCKKHPIEKNYHDDNPHHESAEQHPNEGLHLGWYKHKHKEHYDCGKHLGWYKEKKQKKNKCEDKEDKKDKKNKKK